MNFRHYIKMQKEQSAKWTTSYRIVNKISWLLTPIVIFLMLYKSGAYDLLAMILLFLIVLFEIIFGINNTLKYKP